MDNREIRLNGKRSLKGNYLVAIANLVVITIISYAFQMLFTGPTLDVQNFNTVPTISGGTLLLNFLMSIVSMLVMSLLNLGYNWGFLDIQEGKQMTVGYLFAPFKYQAQKAIAFVFRRDLLILLWSLLLIIPGIIKSFAWALTDFIYHDEPDLSNREILEKSEQMMQGNKWKLFRLEFYYVLFYLIPIIIWMISALFIVNNNTNMNNQIAGVLFLGLFAGFMLVIGVSVLLTFVIEPKKRAARAAFYKSLLY